jgi:uncharacterized protein YecE (DUF72 family)
MGRAGRRQREMNSAGSGCHIGTSGWSYQHWRKRFYPEELPSSRWLGYYADRFSSVEINSSFYRLPSEDTLAGWRDAVPDGFIFAVKASRYITHMKKLKEPKESLSPFLERLEVLGAHRGPLLFQLPPRWGLNPGRLEGFLEALPSGLPCAFEFRDPSWFHPATYEALGRHGAAFCVYEMAGVRSPKEVTADFVYVRLHGPGDAYQGSYATPALAAWAGAFSTWNRQGKSVYCYFDNDQNAYAAGNALELSRMVEGD